LISKFFGFFLFFHALDSKSIPPGKLEKIGKIGIDFESSA
jgi:hypothetical protein